VIDRWVRAGAAIASVLMILLLGLPILALLLRAVGIGLDGASIADILRALGLSLASTAVALVLTVLLGTPLAYGLARGRIRGARFVEPIIDLPIVLPPAVAGLALLLLLGRRGPIGSLLADAGLELPFTTAAVVIAQIFVSAPFFVRAARAGFADVSHEIEDAARVDGAGDWAVFRHVVAPMARTALAAGMVMAWARALGEFGATIMFAGNIVGRTQTLPLFVYSEFQSSLDASIAAGAVLVATALAVLVAVRLLGWRSITAMRSIA
jgi:molybdate transport system permease protein